MLGLLLKDLGRLGLHGSLAGMQWLLLLRSRLRNLRLGEVRITRFSGTVETLPVIRTMVDPDIVMLKLLVSMGPMRWIQHEWFVYIVRL